MRQRPTADTTRTADALNRICDIAFGFVGTQALMAGHELGIFEALRDGSLSLHDVARRTELKPVACRRLLMALATLGLIEREGEKFRNTDLGQFCTSQSAVNLGPLTRMGPFDHLCEYLPDAIREYGPRWQQALGAPAEDTFASLYADPVGLRRFADMMDGFSIPQGKLIAECFDFSDRRCLMDVAGGPGGQAIAIGLKHPHLQGIITDLEPVCRVATERIEANGLGDRFTAEPADLLSGPYPDGADVILLGHILHDWSDNTCLTILRNSAAALPNDGVLLISESTLAPDFSGRNLANLKDLVMLVCNESDARERTTEEYRALLDAAGFQLEDVIELNAPRDLLVAKKRE